LSAHADRCQDRLRYRPCDIIRRDETTFFQEENEKKRKHQIIRCGLRLKCVQVVVAGSFKTSERHSTFRIIRMFI
ncbi:hypothetical protein ANCCAN_02308, partial [Ancylostoma caninum]